MSNARFRYKASIEKLEYSTERRIDKNQVHHLADGEYCKKTIADAVFDRIIHSAKRIELKGESLRKWAKKETINID